MTLFGIGLVLVGFGVVPSITALVFEYSAPHRRNVNTAVAFAGIGIGIGGAASAVVAATVVPAFGFRSEFLVGGLAALVILPLAVAFLPESLAHLRAAGREADARRWATRLGIDPEPARTDGPRGGRTVYRPVRRWTRPDDRVVLEGRR